MLKSAVHNAIQEINENELPNPNIKILGNIICKALAGKASFLNQKEGGREELLEHKIIKREGRISFELTAGEDNHKAVIENPAESPSRKDYQLLKGFPEIIINGGVDFAKLIDRADKLLHQAKFYKNATP